MWGPQTGRRMAGWPENLGEEGWRAEPRPQGQAGMVLLGAAGGRKMVKPGRKRVQRSTSEGFCTGPGEHVLLPAREEHGK